MNSDYKIAAKSITNRLKPFLPNLINCDQTVFIRGRFIGENIRLTESVIAKENNIQWNPDITILDITISPV